MCEERTNIFIGFLDKAFKAYCSNNGGKRPEMIAIYRDGVGGPISETFVTELEGPNSGLMEAIRGFAQNYNPKILYTMINKKSGTRNFE